MAGVDLFNLNVQMKMKRNSERKWLICFRRCKIKLIRIVFGVFFSLSLKFVSITKELVDYKI